MELTILHLYPDCMSLYGEYANIAVLGRHLEAIGVSVTVKPVLFEDTPDFARADFIYMGAGTERTQKVALEALRPHAVALKAAVERGAVALFTGNAMELLGASVTDPAGKKWEGLGLGGFTTEETDKRTPGDVIAMSDLWESPVVGFMNKCSVTRGVDSPLFPSLSLGFGNEREQGSEGYVAGNLFATHITGPVLVKNPDFTFLLIRRIFEARGWPQPDGIPVLPHEMEAYEVTLKELRARIGA